MKISDIFDFECLENAKIIAGYEGINKEITSISVLEVSNEKIKNWVLEGQLYITSFYAISTNVEMQKTVIKSLVEKKSSGLILCHFNIVMRILDSEIIKLCNELKFPLIIADSNVSYIEMMEPIIKKLDISKKFPNSMEKVISTFADAVGQFNDYSTIFNYIEIALNYIFIVVDNNNEIIYPKKEKHIENIVDKFDLIVKSNYEKEYKLNIEGEVWQRNYILSNNKIYGAIIGKCNLEEEFLMIKLLSKLSSIVLEKKLKYQDLRRVQYKTYISDLLTWNFRSRQNAINRGENIGWNIENTNKFIIININEFQNNHKKYIRDIEKIIDEIIMPKIMAKFSKNIYFKNIYFYNDMIICLVSKELNENKSILFEFLENIKRIFENNSRLDISIGISDIFYNIEDIPKSYKEATLSYKIARKFNVPEKYIMYEDIESYEKLMKNKFSKNKIEKALSKLDDNLQEEYYSTLEALVMNDLNIDKASKQLYLHRNTVLYRKNKIIELMEYDIFKMPYLFSTMCFVLENIVKKEIMVN
ncbi:PucR family transcriptional regulator [Miniphocaeibacter massiliensis]|uniref:PucR family transcriptional regulator n=1 Tax=Miniphocaeibacter massiliensis TaxID=2041841 RepID=UPI000C1C7540|nr:PucR family transcriptional regulator [Miniphocaeibacter massiliensis]